MFDFFGKKDAEPAEGPVADPAEAPVTDGEQPTNEAASTQEVSPAVEPSNAADVSRFEKAFPNFAGCYDALSPDMRARMLYDKIEATSTPVSPDGDESDSTPTIRIVPTFNMEMATAELARATQDGDAEAIASAQKAILEYHEDLMGWVHDHNAVNAHKTQQLQTQMAKLQRPSEILSAGSTVKGFEQTDVAAATQLLDSGQITDITAAVKFAVYQRLATSNKAVPPDAAEQAARQAKAIAAASAPDSEQAGGGEEITATPSFTDPKFAEAVHRAAQAGQQQT